MTIGQAATTADPVSSSSYWRIDYGNLRGPDPFNHRPVESRPGYISTLYFHSLPAALHRCFTWTPGSWWEILMPDGRVAVSSRAGVNEEVVGESPPLIVQQLLHSRYGGMFPESVEEGPRDRVSHDDGETWQSVLLGEKEEVRKLILPSLPKPESVEILTVSPSPEPDRIVLTHATGSMTVQLSALELKRSRTGYSLQVLGTPRGTYTRDVGEGAAILLQSLGVQIAEEKEKPPKGFAKAWKPALFKVQKKEGEPLEVKGWTRGLLGIDKRSVETSSTYTSYDGKEYTHTYTRFLYHLTHLPTGLLIASWKHKNAAQDFADLLRERMPEITDTGVEEVTPETGKRVGEILDEYSA